MAVAHRLSKRKRDLPPFTHSLKAARVAGVLFWLGMKRCGERLLLVLQFGTPEIAEIGSALAAILFGLWLASPSPMFALYPATFHPMAIVAVEWVWATGISSVGALQLCMTASGSRQARRVASLVSLALWVFLSLVYLREDGAAPVTLFACLGALSNAWIHRRIRGWQETDG